MASEQRDEFLTRWNLTATALKRGSKDNVVWQKGICQRLVRYRSPVLSSFYDTRYSPTGIRFLREISCLKGRKDFSRFCESNLIVSTCKGSHVWQMLDSRTKTACNPYSLYFETYSGHSNKFFASTCRVNLATPAPLKIHTRSHKIARVSSSRHPIDGLSIKQTEVNYVIRRAIVLVFRSLRFPFVFFLFFSLFSPSPIEILCHPLELKSTTTNKA